MQGITTTHSYLWNQAAVSDYAAPTRESIAFLKQLGAWAEPSAAATTASLLSPLPVSAAPAPAVTSPEQRPFAEVFAGALAAL